MALEPATDNDNDTDTRTLTTTTIPPPNPHPTRLHGRAFYTSLGAPKHILAPMVEHSHLAWRLLVSRHSPKPSMPPSPRPTDPSASPTDPPILSYTPMLHSRLYHSTPSYPHQNFPAAHNTLDGHPQHDRPLLAQFCANDPAAFLASAELISPYVDGVDLNLGCPQGIARKGRYGSFLQDEWPLINSLIGKLHSSRSLSVPVTAKIRIFPDPKKTLAYAKMVLSSGASILAVHGRTREQKGHNTGLADWEAIRHLRENLPPDTVIFANGNILYPGDAQRCLAATGADAVLSAEGCLYNPTGIFLSPDHHPPEHLFPRMDIIAREYLTILRTKILPYTDKGDPVSVKAPVVEPNLTNVKSHLFKLLHALLPRFPDIRARLATSRPVHPRNDAGVDPLRDFEEVVRDVEKVVRDELERNPEEKVVADAAPVQGSVIDGGTGLVKVGEWNCNPGGWVGPKRRRGRAKEEKETGDEGGEEEAEEKEIFGWDIPFYRCQPNFRPLPEEAVKRGAMSASALGKGPSGGAPAADMEMEMAIIERVGRTRKDPQKIDGAVVKRAKVTE
ncbi:FMN-linked oxidoreductase [Terfezia boudieri ATCC MYA-4762]|uniref:tRNA-dihydrouridine(16/17) synthase [NAD(P)(+)] n=1 Tax=Terfezia boudieri ATCC MYA-4762 TaxID=1051890 RepID=A0A3N4LC80_9PEZI|nr:FMN-linked oxidoreductase [Terfezia boudieri ATCC MYA-4762]